MQLWRAIASLVAVAGGAILGSVSIFGVLGNYYEWDVHSCSAVQPDPVCSPIFWGIVEFILIALVGVVLVAVGFYYLGREVGPRGIPSARNNGSDSTPPN